MENFILGKIIFTLLLNITNNILFFISLEYEYLRSLIVNSEAISEEEWNDTMKVIAASVFLSGVTLLGAESTIISSGTKPYITQAEHILGITPGILLQGMDIFFPFFLIIFLELLPFISNYKETR